MLTIQTDIFGNATTTKTETITQLGLFSATDTLAMSNSPVQQLPLEEITDRLTAAMIGKKYVTAQGLSFASGLLPRDVALGLTTLKLSGRVVVSVTKKKIEEELYSLA